MGEAGNDEAAIGTASSKS